MMAILLVPLGWAGVPIVGFTVWILLIWLIMLVVRGMRSTARETGGPAVRLLDERYARGEITREEFLERRALLDRTWPDAERGASFPEPVELPAVIAHQGGRMADEMPRNNGASRSLDTPGRWRGRNATGRRCSS
jgi:putative membrane protein